MMSWLFGGGGNAKAVEKKPEPQVEAEMGKIEPRPVEDSDWLGDVDGGADLQPEEVVEVKEEKKKEVSRLQYLKIDEATGAVE
jgi:hypothetical protein